MILISDLKIKGLGILKTPSPFILYKIKINLGF